MNNPLVSKGRVIITMGSRMWVVITFQKVIGSISGTTCGLYPAQCVHHTRCRENYHAQCRENHRAQCTENYQTPYTLHTELNGVVLISMWQ